MHILVVTQYFWPENFRINDIVAGLHQRGHHVTVLTGHPNYPTGAFTSGYSGRQIEQEQYEGIRVIRVPMLPRGHGNGVRLALNYLSYAFNASVLGPLLIRQPFDVIFVYEPSPMTVGFPAMVMKRKSGRPIAFYLQDLWPESLVATGFVSNPILLKAVEWVIKWIYRSCDLILVTSRAFIPRVTRLGHPASRVRYFPQYAETFYAPQEQNPTWHKENNLPTGFTIMFAGNMGTAQDLFTVLEAAAQTEQDGIEWVFLGNGSAKAELERHVQTENIKNVRFLGSFPPSQMPQFFAHADALLISLTDNEIFALTVPAKLQSYLACGKPILASLKGEGAAIVQESEAGLVVPPAQPTALASAARSLKAKTIAERTEMGWKGRRYFEAHFEREAMLTELEDILQNVGNVK